MNEEVDDAMYSKMGLNCLWVNPLKQLKHGLALYPCSYIYGLTLMAG